MHLFTEKDRAGLRITAKVQFFPQFWLDFGGSGEKTCIFAGISSETSN